MSSGTRIEDRRAFILAETTIQQPPGLPEIELHLAAEAVPLWHRTEAELAAIDVPPPFWAFAWAGGRALARYILDHPDAVCGRHCLDFATGSGIVGIAAMLAGAASVESVDIDAFAIEAARLNAERNRVGLILALRDPVGADCRQDVILAGDVCYDRALSGRLVPWLDRLAKQGKLVLIGDPGRTYLPKTKLVELASYDLAVSRDLEDAEIKRSSVWRLETDAAGAAFTP